MHTYLVDMLACPVCHGSLDCQIADQSGDRIETGEARCQECRATYPVREGISAFLSPEQQREGMWEGTTRQVQYILDHPEVERQLLGSPLQTLNPADQFWRACVLEERGEYAETRLAWQRSQEGLYSTESQSHIRDHFAYVADQLSASGGSVVDLASGRCYLVEELLQGVERPIVATDWNLPVLRRDRRYLTYWGLYERASLLAFDARRTPFVDGAVETMTTFVGLPSVGQPQDLLRELRRVVSGTLLAVSVFYPEEDEVHAAAVRSAGLEEAVFRRRTIEAFGAAGWQVEVANLRSAEVRPTPQGVLLCGFQVDGFPITETTQESCIVVAR